MGISVSSLQRVVNSDEFVVIVEICEYVLLRNLLSGLIFPIAWHLQWIVTITYLHGKARSPMGGCHLKTNNIYTTCMADEERQVIAHQCIP